MFYKILAGAAGLALSVGLSQTAVAQAAADGATLFKQRCQSCHQVAAGKPSTIGPNLYGVVNRKAASAPVPFKYSEALKKSGLTWTRPNLDKYLTAPTKLIPGTRMVIALPNPAQRKAVLDFLARAK